MCRRLSPNVNLIMGLLWSVDACFILRDYEELQNNYYFGIFHLLQLILIRRFGNCVRFHHTLQGGQFYLCIFPSLFDNAVSLA